MKIKKVIISLNNLSIKKFREFEKFENIESYSQIWDKYPMIEGAFDPNKMTKEISTLEPYFATLYLKSKNIEYEIFFNESLFILNDKLYRIRDSIEEIELKTLYFISFRESWQHPFFKILKVLLKKNGGKLSKPNLATMNNVGCMNKFYSIAKLYKYRDLYLQNIAIPYNLKQRDYKKFVNFLKSNLSSRVVIKIDCTQEGKGVIFRDLNQDNIDSILDTHKVKSKEIFIMPSYDIESEYRVYFTKKAKELKIFSIKERVNLTQKEKLFQRENIHIYKNIDVKWSLIDSRDKIEYISKISKKILKKLGYRAGCLEFGVLKNGEILFLEVNQMAGPLTFNRADSENLTKFYISMIENLFHLPFKKGEIRK